MDAALIEARGLDKTFAAVPILRGVNLAVVARRCRDDRRPQRRRQIDLGTAPRRDSRRQPPARRCCSVSPAARSNPPMRRRLAIVTHQSFLYPNLTARENLEFYADLYGVARRAC